MPGLIYGHREGGMPIIDCEICLPTPEGQEIDSGRSGVPVRALVDTGASHVIATSKVISAASLVHGGSIDNTTVGFNARSRPWFSGDVVCRGKRYVAPHKPYTFTFPRVQIIEDHLSGFDLILGWDVLHAIGLQFEPNNTFVLRLP